MAKQEKEIKLKRLNLGLKMLHGTNQSYNIYVTSRLKIIKCLTHTSSCIQL